MWPIMDTYIILHTTTNTNTYINTAKVLIAICYTHIINIPVKTDWWQWLLMGNNDLTTRQLQNLSMSIRYTWHCNTLINSSCTLLHTTNISSPLKLASPQNSGVKVKSVRWMTDPWWEMVLIEGLVSMLEPASCFLLQLCGQHLNGWCMVKHSMEVLVVPILRQVWNRQILLL